MAEAYNVGIRVALVDAASAGILKMASHFATAEGAAAGFRREMKAIERNMAMGAMQVGLGVGIAAMFKPALDQAKKFQQEVTKFGLYGMGDAATSEATRFSKAMSVMGSSYVDNMRLMNEAQGIFRESGKRTLAQQLEGAKIAAPVLAKLAFIQSGLSEEKQTSRHAQDLAMLRFVEARGGANDPKSFSKIADWGFKLQQSSGGVVDWAQLQRFIATAGVAGFNLKQDAISALEPVIADLKGGTTGSGMRTTFQRLMGTQRGLPKQAIQEYMALGLWDPTKVQLNAQGGISRFTGRPGEVLKDREKFATDPVAFFTQDFLPAIAKKYGPQILDDSVSAKVQRAAEISMVFGPGNAGGLFAQIDKLMPAIQRSLAAQNMQFGIDASYKAAGGTLAGKEVAAAANWKNVMETIGESVLPIAIQGLNAIQPPLKWIADFGQHHPRMFGFMIDGLIGLSAVTAGAGMVNLFKGVGGLAKLFAPIAGAEGLLGLAVMVDKIPIIGAAMSGAALDAGIFLGALTAPAWGSIALVTAGVVALGVAMSDMEKYAPAATKKLKADNNAYMAGFFDQLTADFRKHFVTPMEAMWSDFTKWLSKVIPGYHDPNANAPAAKKPGLSPAQQGKADARSFEHWITQNSKIARRSVDDEIVKSTKGLISAINGLVNHLGGSAAGVSPSTAHKGDVHFHAHGVSDPRKFMKDAVAALTGGPQHGSSMFDGSAVMPQVSTRYTA
jgi:hypothetical protein